MLYSTIPDNKIQELTRKLLAGESFDENDVITQQGLGSDQIDLSGVDNLSKVLEAELNDFKKSDESKMKDLFEGRISGRIHQELVKLPIGVLDDPGFWRYLTITKFWWLVYWRQQETFDDKPYEKYRVYVDGKRSHEAIPTRLFLRGQIALTDDDSYELAESDEEAADFWRSHITRVLTWTSPVFARSLVGYQKRKHMKTDVVRPFARKMNRRRSSIILDSYNDEESLELINELKQDS
jgi:hypothetical protein